MTVVVLLCALLLVGACFMLGSLNFAAVRVERDRVTTDALMRAREALIAYAVSDPNRPGELPCPDVDDDGRSTPGVEYVGANCASLIGRLPWFTLGLPDLRDDAGERLWYALSNDFRAGGPVPLNNDTAFRLGHSSLTLTPTGQQSASNLVAIVFSPGAVLQRQGAANIQQRSCTGGSCDITGTCTSAPVTNTPKCNAVNYLDIASGEDNSDANPTYVSAAQTDTFNDRLMPIHSDDIMWLVERRAGREFAQKLREHYDTWKAATGQGFYPWAAPFTDPANMQVGQNGREEGLLPMSAAPVVWTSASISGGACIGVGTNEIQCSALVVLGIGGDVSGRVGNIAAAFVDPPDGSEVSTSGLLLLGTPTYTWTVNRPTQSLDFSSNITFLGTGVVTVRVRAPSTTSAWITAPSWLVTNRWYQFAYYAVAPAFAINGAAVAGVQSCGTCITVANTAAPANKEAIVVMAGRALPLAAQTQTQRWAPPLPPPPPLESQFLEGGNQTTGDRIFEQSPKTAMVNDLPIVVRP